MPHVRFPAVTALCLLLVASMLAACTTEAPGPEVTATPEPTQTPPSANEVLSQAQEALAGVESLQFAFTRTGAHVGPGSLMEGSGEWEASGHYTVSTEVETCPPPVPGGPEVTDCDLLPWYTVVRMGEHIYSTTDPSGSPATSWDIGTSDPLSLDLLEGGTSPAATIVQNLLALDSRPVAEPHSVEGSVDGTRITVEGPSASYLLDLHGETLQPFHAIVTEADGREWTWSFTDYGESVSIERPVGAPEPPIARTTLLGWFTEKQVDLVYQYAPAEPLWSGLPEHEQEITSLLSALREAEPTEAEPEMSPFAGNFLVIQFTDGASVAIAPAMRPGPNGYEGIEDQWLISARDTTLVLHSADLTTWWDGMQDSMPRLDLAGSELRRVDWPESLRLGEPLVLTGRGWLRDEVRLSVSVYGEDVALGEATVEHGAFRWEGDLPEALTHGEYRFFVAPITESMAPRGWDRYYHESTGNIMVEAREDAE